MSVAEAKSRSPSPVSIAGGDSLLEQSRLLTVPSPLEEKRSTRRRIRQKPSLVDRQDLVQQVSWVGEDGTNTPLTQSSLWTEAAASSPVESGQKAPRPLRRTKRVKTSSTESEGVSFLDPIEVITTAITSEHSALSNVIAMTEDGPDRSAVIRKVADFIFGDTDILIFEGPTGAGKTTLAMDIISLARVLNPNIEVYSAYYDNVKATMGKPREQFTAVESDLIDAELMRQIRVAIPLDRVEAFGMQQKIVVEFPAIEDRERHVDRGIKTKRDVIALYGERVASVNVTPHPVVPGMAMQTREIARRTDLNEFTQALPGLKFEIPKGDEEAIGQLYDSARNSGAPETIPVISYNWYKEIEQAVKGQWGAVRKIKLADSFKGISQSVRNMYKRIIYYLLNVAPQQFNMLERQVSVFLNTPSQVVKWFSS